MDNDQRAYIAENLLKVLSVIGFDLECTTYAGKKLVYVYVKPWNRCYPCERTVLLHDKIRADYSGDELLGVEVEISE